jgi:hypothetical protein
VVDPDNAVPVYVTGDFKMARRTPEAWRALVAGHGASGLTIEAYCARQGICKGSFYRWQAIQAEKAEVRHPVVRPQAREPAFVDLGALLWRDDLDENARRSR